MREANFSIPNVNKASVSITTTLYDRRALDCTSTLPLINSLNHLAYLTTSSGRIRDILTVDGGVEQLVNIVKEGRQPELMEIWKWNLAFQCLVNIGVRGSENVRTRVVESGMVPVIATILDNYIQVIDRFRSSSDADHHKHCPFSTHINGQSARPRESPHRSIERPVAMAERRTTRRQPPPPSIEIPRPFTHAQRAADAMDVAQTPRIVLTSPPERTTFGNTVQNRVQEARPRAFQRQRLLQPLATTVPSMDTTDGFSPRTTRDTDRLPLNVLGLQSGLSSQPETPTTPYGAGVQQNLLPLADAPPRRPSIHQQRSDESGDSDAANGEEDVLMSQVNASDETGDIVDLQGNVELENGEDRNAMIEDSLDSQQMAPNVSQAHRQSLDMASSETVTAQSDENAAMAAAIHSPRPPTTAPAPTPPLHPQTHPVYLGNRVLPQRVLNILPRDEDALMALQLLAYVSKYCNLRPYFQNSHLVPRLKISKELQYLDGIAPSESVLNESMEEYILPDDYNIFPLVEKFTVRHHSRDLQYWASVVMRNLCRKDESRGGIRQCAYYKCGKWEEYQRQFAKCRRCRRTKYCSKECQKNAWVFHRHWCRNAP